MLFVFQGLALGVKYFYNLNPDFLLQIINDYLVYAPTEVCIFDTRGAFGLAKIFGWKFRKLSMSNGKAFFSRSNFAILLVDEKTYAMTQRWCKKSATWKWEFCANGTVI